MNYLNTQYGGFQPPPPPGAQRGGFGQQGQVNLTDSLTALQNLDSSELSLSENSQAPEAVVNTAMGFAELFQSGELGEINSEADAQKAITSYLDEKGINLGVEQLNAVMTHLGHMKKQEGGQTQAMGGFRPPGMGPPPPPGNGNFYPNIFG
ncbi:MAG: hypothetical protein HRT47_03020 [Candidatus Caenarcaniphilales bacterium]|nr:hypothetical protein [Candidatus Caenarcaniphilales bacterium]